MFIAFGLGLLMAAGLPGAAQAVVGGDVYFGVASSQTPINFSTVDTSNFTDHFTNAGATEPSLTIGGNVEAQIGAIYDDGLDTGQWYQMRIVIDSNGDGSLTPFDWSAASHPWNRPDNGTPEDPSDDPTSWTYTYPNDYPNTSLAGETITITWSSECGCIQDFPWDTWDQWFYEQNQDADKTDSWWMEAGQLMNTWWSGRDQNWKILPNGNYKVKVWVDENNDGLFAAGEVNETLVIKIETASITGTVKDSGGSAIYNARVNAGSYLAWGEAFTRTDGTFTIAGLQAGATYHVDIQADGKVTANQDVNLAAGATTASAGTITLSDAIAITGTLKLDRDANGVTDEVADQFEAFTNQWGWEQSELNVWINAHNMMGPGWGNGEVRFEAGDASAAFTINIPPPSGTASYQINVNAEGYATSPITVSVDADGGVVAEPIVLTKASVLSGTVKLPAAISTWTHIDVQAINTDDTDDRYWGWGNIDPNQNGGSTDTGTFRIDGIPAGTYTLEVRVMGYQTNTTNNLEIVQGVDKEVGQLTIAEGSKITGTLTIQGDTTDLMRWQGDTEDPLNIWIDAWSPSAGWSGINVQVDRGENQSVQFSLGGLTDAAYEINTWIGEGYELVDENGNYPVFATVNARPQKISFSSRMRASSPARSPAPV